MDDSPWDENPNSTILQETEWSKLSNDFNTVGYREGITAGKEAALQSGFDSGFAEVGVALGRELGMMRGSAAALTAIMSTRVQGSEDLQEKTRQITNQLKDIHFDDIVPRDAEADAHAAEHSIEIEERENKHGKVVELGDELKKIADGIFGQGR